MGVPTLSYGSLELEGQGAVVFCGASNVVCGGFPVAQQNSQTAFKTINKQWRCFYCFWHYPQLLGKPAPPVVEATLALMHDESGRDCKTDGVTIVFTCTNDQKRQRK